MLRFGSLNTGFIGLVWGIFFAVRHDWAVFTLDMAALLLSVACLELVRRDRLRPACFLYASVVYGLITVTAAVVDVPSAEVPRTIHLFLPALAVSSCLFFRAERPWIRHGIPLVCLLTFAVLDGAGSRLGLTAYALPDSIRRFVLWFDEVLSAACLFGGVLVTQADVAERTSMQQDLRNALIREELLLHYQPQVDERGALVGAEALVRWRHPTRGLVPPGEFVPLAEGCGLMSSMGDWILRSACMQLVRWQAQRGICGRPLAVNVSASQFAEPDFVERVLRILSETGASPALLKLELTESVVAEEIDDVVAKMSRLKSHGVRFSLDDFGTGFSSLSYLQRLPLDQLKIDQAFVRNLLRSDQDKAIAKAVVALGQSLGLEVIAEGVETQEHQEFLSSIGCTRYQGYFYSRPLPVAQFEIFAREIRRVEGGVAVQDDEVGDQACGHPAKPVGGMP